MIAGVCKTASSSGQLRSALEASIRRSDRLFVSFSRNGVDSGDLYFRGNFVVASGDESTMAYSPAGSEATRKPPEADAVTRVGGASFVFG